jgi:uroporphyrinogen decarboxylase
MGTLTPRDRVRAALTHNEPDRAPADLCGTYASGIILKAYQELCLALGVQGQLREQGCRDSTAIPDEELLQRLGTDTRGVTVNTPEQWLTPGPDGTRTDGWGVAWAKPPEGHYYVLRSPLAGEPTVADVEALAIPDPEDPRIVEGLVQRVRHLRDTTPYAVCLNIPSRLVHTVQFLRGYAESMVDLVAGEAMLDALMDRITDFNVRAMQRVLALVGDSIDVLCIGDDLGTQKGPFLSPATHRKHIKPRQLRLTAAARALTDARLFYHSCGSVVPLIPDLIDVGVQVLNPIQVSAQGMAPAWLKREFGRDLAFWGGVDTHRVLPGGTPSEVAEEVRRRFRELGPGGGWVCAAVHNIQPDVPAANIIALFETAAECSYG